MSSLSFGALGAAHVLHHDSILCLAASPCTPGCCSGLPYSWESQRQCMGASKGGVGLISLHPMPTKARLPVVPPHQRRLGRHLLRRITVELWGQA